LYYTQVTRILRIIQELLPDDRPIQQMIMSSIASACLPKPRRRQGHFWPVWKKLVTLRAQQITVSQTSSPSS